MTPNDITDPSDRNSVALAAEPVKQYSKLEGAQILARELGLPVFPAHSIENGVCTCGKHQCKDIGKHPRTPNGCKDASTNPEQIKRWWTRWPNANVGVATDGLTVVDEDVGEGKGGAESLRELEARHGALPPTLTVQTGSGGRHFYFRGDSPCSQSVVGRGIDIRGNGGYVIGPPSDHKSGRKYELIHVAPIAQAPEWLVMAANTKPVRGASRVIDANFELKAEHCLQQAKALGRKHSVRDQERQQWWRDIAHGVPLCDRGRKQAHTILLSVTGMIAEAYPTATPESVCKLLLSTWPEGDETEVVNAFTGAAREQSTKCEEQALKVRNYEAAGLALGDKGAVLTTAANITKIMRMPGKGLADCLRINVRGQLLECKGLPWAPNGTWREWTDDDDTHASEWLQDEWGIYVGPVGLRSAVAAAAGRQQVDPFCEWLDGLPTWDREPRAETWLTRVFSGEDTVYTRAISRKFLLSIVARAKQPGCKVDTKLVLVGPQGLKKSTAFEVLIGPEYFSNSAADSNESSKDRLARYHRSVLNEDQEMNTFSRSDVEADKAFLTTKIDMFRPPYGRSVGTYHRRFVQVGTTNEDEGFLHDVTGGRRYWPFRCECRADLEWLAANRDQLWAEVMHVWADESARVWWLTDEEETAAALVQEEHRQATPYEDALRDKLSDPRTTTTYKAALDHVHNSVREGRIQALTTAAALVILDVDEQRREQEKPKVGKALRAVDFRPRGRGRPRRYVTRGYISEPPV